MNELFFELLRVAIGTQEGLSRQPNADEWEELYKMAKKQSLVGICFAGVQKALSRSALKGEDVSAIGMNEKLYLTWLGKTTKIKQRNLVVDQQCVELQKRLSADGLKSSILKGQGVAQLYAGHLRGLRQSGDIDIWIEGGVDTVVKLAESLGQKAVVTEMHVHLDIFENTEVEAHFKPSMLRNPFANARLQNWFKDMAPLQFAHRNEAGLCVPTIEFNLVYLLIHIYRHLFEEGVGMRQVMDYYWTLSNSSLKYEELNITKDTLKKFGLVKFAGAVMYVMREVFGLQREQMLFEPNERHGKFLLNEIMIAGNMGHQDNRLKDALRSTRWQRFCMATKHNMRLIGYYPAETLWAPLTRIKVWAWRKWKGWI